MSGLKKFNDKMNIVAKNIHKYRTMRNMTKPDICKDLALIGVTLYPNDIFKIENFDRSVRDFELYAFTKVLHVTLEQLFEDVEDEFSTL